MSKISSTFSLYLDFVRFSAAMIVMIGHLSGQRLTGGLFWQVGPFMDDAVIVFFVLSGFVIAYASDKPNYGPKNYAIDRAARIYSVALPAIVITIILDLIGKSIAPDSYSSDWGFASADNFSTIATSVFFLNEIWFLSIAVGSMLPYWSLGYEVWYYVLFAIILFAPSGWIPLTLGIALFALGPKIAALFPLWLLGVFIFKFVRGRDLGVGFGLICLSASFVAYISYVVVLRDIFLSIELFSDIIVLDNLIARYFAGVVFGLHMVGAASLLKKVELSPSLASKVVKWLAGSTFTVYLLHLPVAQFFSAASPWDVVSWPHRVLVLLGTFLVCLLISLGTERKKLVWKTAFSCLTSRTRRDA